MEKKSTPATTVGLIIGLFMVVLMLVAYFANFYMEEWVQYVGLAIMVIGIIWGVYNHGKETENTATFGQLFLYGFKIAAIIACVLVAYTIVSGYVFPDVKEKIMIKANEDIDKLPEDKREAGKAGMEMFFKNFTLFMVMTTIFSNLFTGAIASLIGAAVTKRKPKQINFDNA